MPLLKSQGTSGGGARRLLSFYYWRRWFLEKLLSGRRVKEAFKVLDEEWDVLIVLDACRYDVFSRLYGRYGLKGRLEKRVSLGGGTIGWLLGNFGNCECGDVVYVTANPFVDIYVKRRFGKIVSVWKYGWDEEIGTVLPQTMYKYSLYALSRYQGRRFIFHFMQPHAPYVGVGGRDPILDRIRRRALRGKSWRAPVRVKRHPTIVYLGSIYSSLSDEEMKIGYLRNLHITLPYVKRLVDVSPGKVVVTSDHGEIMGERVHPLLPFRAYGHNTYFRSDVAIEVPWLVVGEGDKSPLSLEDELRREGVGKEILRMRLRSSWIRH